MCAILPNEKGQNDQKLKNTELKLNFDNVETKFQWVKHTRSKLQVSLWIHDWSIWGKNKNHYQVRWCLYNTWSWNTNHKTRTRNLITISTFVVDYSKNAECAWTQWKGRRWNALHKGCCFCLQNVQLKKQNDGA